VIFFTSDTHFGHANILRYDSRPFANIWEHDKALIEAWNAVVGPKDEIRHLGDVSWHGSKRTAEILFALNGRIHLIRGNHDKVIDKPGVKERFESIKDLDLLTVQVAGKKQHIVLCHYAMRIWNHSHHGAWHLYGHSHCGLDPHGMSFDVGICCHGYRPLSLDEVVEKMKQRAEEIERKVYKEAEHHDR
jgi:calcineurin-like phosphoesterase family protein